VRFQDTAIAASILINHQSAMASSVVYRNHYKPFYYDRHVVR